jgi:hypothetical protein
MRSCGETNGKVTVRGGIYRPRAEIRDDNGIRHEDRDAMCGIVYNYFSSLFISEVFDPDEGVLADV